MTSPRVTSRGPGQRVPTLPLARHYATLIARLILGLTSATALAVLVAGVPYALWHWIGSPLPRSWPTLDHVRATVTAPFTDHVLLDLLGFFCWIAWAVFVVDVLRAAPSAYRMRATGIRWRTARAPIQTLAILLLGTTVTMLLNLRGRGPGEQLMQPPIAQPTKGIAAIQVVAELPSNATPTITDHTNASVDRRVVVVQAARDGVHDSLWRIAERCLGDGMRWTEIYHLNKDRPQADGTALTTPSLIRPGWTLELPKSAADQPYQQAAVFPPRRAAPRPSQKPGPLVVAPSAPTAAPHPSTRPPPPRLPPASGVTHRDSPAGGIDLGDGLYVSIGLAAAISSSLAAIRRRNRRWYTPGSGRRDDLPVAPVVRSLYRAHLRSTLPEDAADTVDGDDRLDAVTTRRTGRTASLEGLTVHGIGIVGPGAPDAARALLLDLLSAKGELCADVVIPAETVRVLLGQHPPNAHLRRRLHIVRDLDIALEQLEAAVLHRTRLPDEAHRPIVLIARPHLDTSRLQAVLEIGAPHNIGAVLLGQWRSGTSLYVDENAVVTASNSHTAELNGARLHALPLESAAQLFDLLANAEHSTDIRPQPELPGIDDPGGSEHGQRPRTAGSPRIADQLRTRNPPPHPRSQARISASSEDMPASRESDTDASPSSQAISTPTAPLTLRILGPVSLTWLPRGSTAQPVEVTGAVSPRLRELVVLLALHPEGISRARIADTLWPDARPGRPYNNLTTSLFRLRSALASATSSEVADPVTTIADQLRLDPELVLTDYRAFSDAEADARSVATDDGRAYAWRRMITAYGGELAEGLDAEWTEAPREAIRRDAIDAATRLARTLVASDPQQTLDLLETARARDPYNEQLYRDIMRVQRRLGQANAIERTLTLLATRLNELDETPSRETVELASTLQRPIPKAAGSTSGSVGK